MDDAIFAQCLKHMRERRKMSIADVAKEFGHGDNTSLIAEYEEGSRKISIRNRIRLCAILGFNYSVLRQYRFPVPVSEEWFIDPQNHEDPFRNHSEMPVSMLNIAGLHDRVINALPPGVERDEYIANLRAK